MSNDELQNLTDGFFSGRTLEVLVGGSQHSIQQPRGTKIAIEKLMMQIMKPVMEQTIPRMSTHCVEPPQDHANIPEKAMDVTKEGGSHDCKSVTNQRLKGMSIDGCDGIRCLHLMVYLVNSRVHLL
eukprot:Lithocolla_globosa_v1_NODE_4618_length_1398_cov_15.274554.p2 type:complete len:126 gc:universal NODE_4618_length_1398_cov_15.274554:960-583(-)